MAFGNLFFTDISGNVVMNANYSDVRGTQLNAPSLNCTDERSKIALDPESGSYSFQSKHSDIDLGIKKIIALNIKANRTDITIRPQHTDDCRYKITSTDGMLYLPAKYTSRLIKKGNQTSFTTTGANTMPLLAISANFNSVILMKKLVSLAMCGLFSAMIFGQDSSTAVSRNKYVQFDIGVGYLAITSIIEKGPTIPPGLFISANYDGFHFISIL
jgi:hypothetical protein